jgi:hypothetical protein
MGASSVSMNAAVQFGVPVALVVSLALRWTYLRSVRRSMMRKAVEMPAPDHQAPAASSPAFAGPAAPRLELVSANAPAGDAVRAAWRSPWIALTVHVAASFAYGLIITLTWFSISGGIYPWDGVLLFTLYYVWPLVIVVGIVAPLSWRAMALVALAYIALLFSFSAWAMRGTGVTWYQLTNNWWNMNGIGTVLVLASLARPIRAIGPIVVALMTAATAGVFETADLMHDESVINGVGVIASDLGLSGHTGGVIAALVTLGLGALAAILISYALLLVIGRFYQAQWISDQSIQIDAVWLIFAVMHAPPARPLAGLGAFLAYELVARLGLRLLLPRGRAHERPPRLLLLRVFSLGSRSETLFRAFSLSWRYLGSMRMIAGPDLANATVEPHEFLDFLAGRLQRRFITNPEILERRLVESPLLRDPDGRFRVSSFFCHADTWQTVLRRLARESDLVLMDLRGFTRSNQGCVFELHELLDSVQLEHFLLVVDDTTDEAFLSEILQNGWAHVGASSLNRTNAAPRVHLYRLHGAGKDGIDGLLATLASAYDPRPLPIAA